MVPSAAILLRAPTGSHHGNDRGSKAKSDRLHDIFEPRPHRVADGRFGTELAGDAWNGALARARGDVAAQARQATDVLKDTTVFADFGSGNFDGWYLKGEAFGDAPTRSGQWDSASRQPRPATPGLAHSGLLGDNLQGVLSSPTFTITGNSIHYRVAGHVCQIRFDDRRIVPDRSKSRAHPTAPAHESRMRAIQSGSAWP